MEDKGVKKMDGIKLLMKDIGFDKYDSDFDKYVPTISEMVSKHDYQSVIEVILAIGKTITDVSRIRKRDQYFLGALARAEPYLQPKLTEEEYIAKEKADMEAWLSIVGPKWHFATEKELAVSPLTKDMPKRYQHYNLGYLTRVAEEHKCSINHLCEIAGLIPEQLIG
jgi:hypothetical protein